LNFSGLLLGRQEYINSSGSNRGSRYYALLREIGIPNISYCSVLKLKNNRNEVVYYFKPFIDYSNEIDGYAYSTPQREQDAVKEIESSADYDDKSKTRLIQSRVGQGKYRQGLLDDMPQCPFTKVNDERLLIASHIKPWIDSSDAEKIDPSNGLALTPTYDALFDKGFIAFEDDGSLVVSPFISPMNQKRLGITDGKNIGLDRYLNKKRLSYLEYHRENIYQGI
jgi:hypothetical protein